jgi:hypothetical protein
MSLCEYTNYVVRVRWPAAFTSDRRELKGECIASAKMEVL